MNVFGTDMSYVLTETPFAQLNVPALSSATPLPETALGLVGGGLATIELGLVAIVTTAAVVASNSAYFTITLAKRTSSNPGVAVPLAIGTGQLFGTGNGMGSATAWKALPLILQGSASVAPGDAITATISQTGGGLALPASWLGMFPRGR